MGCNRTVRLRYRVNQDLLTPPKALPIHTLCRKCWTMLNRCFQLGAQRHKQCEHGPSPACLDKLRAFRLPAGVQFTCLMKDKKVCLMKDKVHMPPPPPPATSAPSTTSPCQHQCVPLEEFQVPRDAPECREAAQLWEHADDKPVGASSEVGMEPRACLRPRCWDIVAEACASTSTAAAVNAACTSAFKLGGGVAAPPTRVYQLHDHNNTRHPGDTLLPAVACGPEWGDMAMSVSPEQPLDGGAYAAGPAVGSNLSDFAYGDIFDREWAMLDDDCDDVDMRV